MTVSIRRMSLGSGFAYLMNSVARGDGAVAGSSPLTRYYAESGTPPGRFLGAGLAGLDGGRGVPAGTAVSEEALWRMLGMMADPATSDPVGRRPQSWPVPLGQRIAARIAALPTSLNADERARVLASIETEEKQREASIARPVAAFDLTFSVPKSVSVLWALADSRTQEAVYAAHREAIDTALSWAERNVIFTRTGAGGAVQEDVRGVVAAAFDHWDSRAGDPHLHTHVVIANRMQGPDGTWRSIDSKTLFRYTVALSELHEGVLQDLLTDRLGVAWEQHARRHSVVPRHDVAGVPRELIDEFSTRSRDIASAKDELVDTFVAAHGRHPSNVEVLKLRQQATLATRPDKEHHTLAERMSSWRRRARQRHARDPTDWTPEVLRRSDLPRLDLDTFTDETLRLLAARALQVVAEKRATFGHANVLAEVHRQLHGLRFASTSTRLELADRITHFALDQALPLDPAALEPIPTHLQRPDGTSKLRHHGAGRFTTAAILDAETRLIDASDDLTAPAVPAAQVATTATGLGDDQALAITSIATSGRVLDLLVGPAGTGKTTSLTALKTAWETTYGPGKVVGLAPSAVAAQVLADELGIPTENTAKWITEHRRNLHRASQIDELHRDLDACGSLGSVRAQRLAGELNRVRTEIDRWSLRPGQLVLIDEASLAGTLTLDALVSDARKNSAKVVLVGDWAQVGAIDAGGAFHMLATHRNDTPELATVRRFTNTWEADASLRLRAGDPSVIDTYLDHDRVTSGDRADMLHALFDAWREDVDRGLVSAMIAPDDATVADLNALAQAHRIDTGQAEPGGVQAPDGHLIGVGDVIVTRRNDRRLRTSSGWVKNGDTWIVTAQAPDGSLSVRGSSDEEATLPCGYLTAHVELGYATTIHRAQGSTFDTAHALIATTTTREALYVAATRARSANHLYITRSEPDVEISHGQLEHEPPRTTLEVVLANSAAETSAHAALLQEEQTRNGPSLVSARTTHDAAPPPIAVHRPNHLGAS